MKPRLIDILKSVGYVVAGLTYILVMGGCAVFLAATTTWPIWRKKT